MRWLAQRAGLMSLVVVVLNADSVLGREQGSQTTLPAVQGLPVPSPAVAGDPEPTPPPFETPVSPPPPPPPTPRRDDLSGLAGGFGGIGIGGPGSGMPGYSATWYPSRPVGGQGVDFGLVRQNLSLAVPLWREGGNMLALTGSIRNTLFFTDAILPESGRAFPNDLWNMSAGLIYTRRLENGWTAGAITNIGSASDKPFNSINEMTLGLGAFVRIPTRNDRDMWMLGVFYSPVGNVDFPLPLIAYVWNPSDKFRANIGLPFSILWRPTERLTFNFSYVPIINVNARVTYRLTEKASVYGAFEWLNEAYLLANRANNDERFLGYEKRLVGGFRYDVWTHGTLELNTGYVFDRFYGVGENAVGNVHDRVDIAPGVFLGASFRLRF